MFMAFLFFLFLSSVLTAGELAEVLVVVAAALVAVPDLAVVVNIHDAGAESHVVVIVKLIGYNWSILIACCGDVSTAFFLSKADEKTSDFLKFLSQNL